MSILKYLQPRILAAVKAASPAAAEFPSVADCAFNTAPASKGVVGDVQCRGLLSAAKRLKLNPQEFAAEVIGKLDLGGIGKASVDGPGFINIQLHREWVGERVGKLFFGGDERLGADKWDGRVVIDYSSPNLAKEMHVGHLRSTIIGDAIARILGFVGADVVRQNHVGDWGTQFGMLIAHVYEQNDVDLDKLQDLEQLYVQAKVRFDADKDFADTAREYVVRLQSGEQDVKRKWEQIVEVSIRHAQRIYDTLGVLLKPSDVRGESFYNNDLNNVVTDLEKTGILVVDDGAKVVYTPAFQKDFGKGKPIFMVQKAGDGFGYAATDLAAIRFRVRDLKAQRILYVVDNRQSLHFKQLFNVAKRGGFLPENVQATHVGFGTMMGKDRKPFKTRTGGTVKLAELISSAQERAYQLAKEKNNKRPEADRFSDEELKNIATKVGIGAVKYADLSKSREKDYVFDLDAMLQFEGNTAPYLMYAYTRARSVARASSTTDSLSNYPLVLTHPAEHTLAVTLLHFPDELATVVSTSFPHHLCVYLYRVATAYSKFYEACPILKSEEGVRESRLRLCAATAEMLKTGLGLLGIGVLEVM